MTHRLEDDSLVRLRRIDGDETKRGWRWFMLFWAPSRWLINDSARSDQLSFRRLFFCFLALPVSFLSAKEVKRSHSQNGESILNSSSRITSLCGEDSTWLFQLIRITNFISISIKFSMEGKPRRFLYVLFYSVSLEFMILISLSSHHHLGIH